MHYIVDTGAKHRKLTHMEVEVDLPSKEPLCSTMVPRLVSRGEVESWRENALRLNTGEGIGGSGFTFCGLKQ